MNPNVNPQVLRELVDVLAKYGITNADADDEQVSAAAKFIAAAQSGSVADTIDQITGTDPSDPGMSMFNRLDAAYKLLAAVGLNVE